ISPNSAKINTAVGGIVLEKFGEEKNPIILAEKLALSKKHLNKAIEMHPQYFEAYNLLGNAHFIAKEYKDAISKYEFILKNKLDDKDAKSNLALCYRELGRFTGMNENNPKLAIEYLTKSIQLNQKDEEAISLLGVANGVLGNYDRALEVFNSILTINPKSADTYFNLYLTYLNKGDKAKAEECLNKAKSIDPKILERFNQTK
ncbi:MAG: tetratricopeptide repeat protein, partial [Saprospiraceae bacterium]